MNWQAFTLNALRIVVGLLFVPHGAQKLFGLFGGQSVELVSRSGLAGSIEFFGGFLILVGFQTRWTAFLCSGLMAFAYWIAHAPDSLWPILNRGELAFLYCFVFLFLWANGGGDFSIDGILKKKT
jgi:putative oxidoreductase